MDEKQRSDPMSQANKALMRRMADTFNDRNLDGLDDLYATDVRYHGATGVELNSLEDLKGYLKTFVDALSDLRTTVNPIVFEGDMVVAHFVVSGTHTADLEDIPPTGKRIEGVRGLSMTRISGGKIVEEWEVVDQLGMMQQLGVIPGSEEAT